MNLLDLDAPETWLLVLGANEPGGAMIRQAKASTCPACGAHRIHGLDGDICALPAKVDPRPLSAFGEVLATMAGLRTYELRRTGGAFQLDWRGADQMTARPAGAIDVLVEHRCGFILDHGPPVLRLPPPPNPNAKPDF